jgi:flagellar FliL protein
MKRVFIPPPRGMIFFHRVVFLLLIVLLAVILAGSLYAFLRQSDSGPLFRIGRNNAGAATNTADATEGIFTGIGRLRIPIAGQSNATLILSISFPYSAGDRPFAEELASRTGEFRSIASGYFASLSIDSIINLNEEHAKAAILNDYNALLRLGNIEILYFSDLMIIE